MNKQNGAPSISKEAFLDFCFISLNFLFFCSLNSVVTTVTGRGEFASPIILVLCTAMVLLTGIRQQALIKKPVLLYLLLIGSYFLIGILARVYYAPVIEYDRAFSKILRDVLTSSVVIIAYLHYLYYRLVVNPNYNRVFWGLTLPLLSTAGIIILQNQLGITSFKSQISGSSERTLGVFINPNIAATASNLASVIALDLFFRQRRWVLVGLALVALAIFSTLLTYSRTGIVISFAILITAGLYFTIHRKRGGHRKYVQLFIIVVLPLISATYFVLNYETIKSKMSYYQRTRMEAMEAIFVKGEINSKTTAERSEIFPIAINMIQQRPLFGWGIGKLNDLPNTPGVHNTYLLVWGNAGIIPFSFLIILLFFVLPFYAIRKRTFGFLVIGFTVVSILSFMTSHNAFDDKILILAFLLPVALAAYDTKNDSKT